MLTSRFLATDKDADQDVETQELDRGVHLVNVLEVRVD